MALSLTQIKDIDHNTLLASGNLSYRRVLEELAQLRLFSKFFISCQKVLIFIRLLLGAQNTPMNDESSTLYDINQSPPIYVKFFPDGRRLVYRVNVPNLAVVTCFICILAYSNLYHLDLQMTSLGNTA